jgi:hypothetical protein
MAYYTDFIIKFPNYLLGRNADANIWEDFAQDHACLAVIEVLIPSLEPHPLENTMWTDLPSVTQQEVHAVVHGLPWTRPETVQVLFREQEDERFSDCPTDQVSIEDGVRGVLQLVEPKTLLALRRIQDPVVRAWVERYIAPHMPFPTRDVARR